MRIFIEKTVAGLFSSPLLPRQFSDPTVERAKRCDPRAAANLRWGNHRSTLLTRRETVRDGRRKRQAERAVDRWAKEQVARDLADLAERKRLAAEKDLLIELIRDLPIGIFDGSLRWHKEDRRRKLIGQLETTVLSPKESFWQNLSNSEAAHLSRAIQIWPPHSTPTN